MTRTPSRPRRRVRDARVPARFVFAVMMTIAVIELGILASLVRYWPPATGDGRSVLAVVISIIGLVVWWRAERPEDGDR